MFPVATDHFVDIGKMASCAGAIQRKKVIVFFFFIFDEETGTSVPAEMDVEDDQNLEFFFNDKVRRVWHKQKEEWYFSVVDVCQVLTESENPQVYWRVLKKRLSDEGNQTVTNCHGLKMKAADGKMRKTDAANAEQLLRIIQSIPSKRAEPFKLWLAQIGRERMEEMADPSLAFDRMIQMYRVKGYSEAWIAQRLESIEVRKGLTDEWKRADVQEGKDYAILTNGLTKAWSGKTVKEYKQYKGLHKENLRDNMTDIEITLNQLAEISATMISKVNNPKGLSESMEAAVSGGKIAGNARSELEQQLGQSVISPLNASDPALLNQKNKN